MAVAPVVGFLELLVLMVIGAGAGIPVGVPPGPHDPYLFSIAPDRCLYYTTWAAMAEPDPDSANSAERLMAEPEVRQFIVDAEQQIRQWMVQTRAPAKAELQLPLLKYLLTHSAAVFVEDVQPTPDGFSLDAALVLSLGKDVDKFREIMGAVEDSLGDLPTQRVQLAGSPFMTATIPASRLPVTWGIKGEYFMLAVGEQTIQRIFDREGTPVPTWLSQLRDQADIERPGTYTFADLKSMIMMGAAAGGSDAANVIDALGLNAISTYTSCSGLDQQGFVSRTKVTLDGAPTGILKILQTEGLQKSDIAAIPRDALVAAAARFDAAKLLDGWFEIVGQLEPRGADEARAWIRQMEQALGIDLRQDVLNSLGRVWSLHTSPGSGGLMTGWTLMASLDNPQRVKELHGRLLGFAQGMMLQDPAGPRITTFKFQGTDVFTLEVPSEEFVVAPSWCISDRHLVLGLMPQSIKAHLARGADAPSLVDRPEVAALFGGERTPAALTYTDTRRLFETIYPLALAGIRVATSDMRRQGVSLDISMFPSIAAISPHLTPSVAAILPTDGAFEVLVHQSLPGGTLGATTPVSVALLLPALQSSRQTARRAQAMNHLKQLALAMHNYHDVTKGFPPAANVDADGKPLLSWRVHILPFLEQQALYEQFHLDEPWDSEHNRQLIARMPDVFKAPDSRAEPGKTVYLGNASQKGVFVLPPDDQRGKERWPTGTRIAQIRDGTSNTIMIVEANDSSAVIWTKPSDFEPDEDNPLAGLLGLRPEGVLSALCDGSVRVLAPTLDKSILLGLFSKDGGEIVDFP